MDARQGGIGVLPFNHFLGIEVVRVTAAGAELRLAMRPELANHFGIMHAVPQYGLGEATCGAAVFAAFADHADRALLLNAKAQITYRRPASGSLTGRASLPPEVAAQALADFAATDKARFSTTAELTDETGEVVTTVTVDWVIVPRPA